MPWLSLKHENHFHKKSRIVPLNPAADLVGSGFYPKHSSCSLQTEPESENCVQLCLTFPSPIMFTLTKTKKVFTKHMPATHFCPCCPCSVLKEKKQGKSILVSQVSQWGPVYSQEFSLLYKQGPDTFRCLHSHLIVTICKIFKSGMLSVEQSSTSILIFILLLFRLP